MHGKIKKMKNKKRILLLHFYLNFKNLQFSFNSQLLFQINIVPLHQKTCNSTLTKDV